MNTENKKNCWRFFIGILFWIIIFCLALLLVPSGGTGKSGMGTGSGSHGRGTGRGQGTFGTSKLKSGTGNSKKAQAEGPENAAPPAVQKTAVVQPAKIVSAKPTQSRTENSKAPLKILSTDAASEDTATIYRPGKNTGSGSPAGTSSGFFGVEITGSSLFLLDVSGSMASSGNEGKSRIDLVKQEMEKTLSSKYKDAQKRKSRDRFRIVCFSSSFSFFPDQNLGAYKFSSLREMSAAIDFIKQLSPSGSTNMKQAWDLIIPILQREEIKSVYFLSDGDPTDCTPENLLAQLKAEVPKLTIHTISMGQASALLQSIAKQHNGQYREVY